MRVMIMAAGLGTRLRPLTEHLPKPVAPVGNRPCVDYLLRRIADAGCTGAIMNLHYHPQTIIGPAVIGPRATICTGAHVEQALVLPEATITADSPRTGILGDPTLLDGVWSR